MILKQLRYGVSEGILNIRKNKLSALMAVSIVFVSLLLVNAILAVSLNIKYNSNTLKKSPEIEIFCYPDISDEAVSSVEADISTLEGVEEIIRMSKSENFESYKEYLGDRQSILDGYDESIMSVSFIVKPERLSDIESIAANFENDSRIQSVQYPSKAIGIIQKISVWTDILTIAAILFVCVTSAFVISNTIRIALMTRKREIGIMRLIGATDQYIRTPFAAESVMVGLTGAAAASIVGGAVYFAAASGVAGALASNGLSYISLISTGRVLLWTIPINLCLSVLTGYVGCYISLKKYMEV